MTFHPIPLAAEIVINQTLFANQVVNRLYATKGDGTPFTQSELADLAEAVATAWIGGVLQAQSNDMKWNNVQVTDVQAPGGAQALYLGGGPYSGIVSDQSAPGNVAFCIKLATGRIGRSYRGRMYIGGLPQGAIDNNAITLTEAGNLASGVNAVIDAIATAGWEAVIVSEFADKVRRVTPVTTPITTATYVDLNTDSMRSRLNRRGN